MKLIIQIPCYNEEKTLPATIADLPKQIDGIDTIEYLVIDDGSTDNTCEAARASGVHHIVRFKQNKGLARGFCEGLDACLRLGADIIVNTDADNQYNGADIPQLVQPILRQKADMVIGSRPIEENNDFTNSKKRFQKIGSLVVRVVSGTKVPDAPSGFRAYSRDTALRINVVNSYTYTLETIIQAGHNKTAIDFVPIRTNAQTRKSRLFKSMWAYMRRSATVIIRSFAMYKPLRFFSILGTVFSALGLAISIRFLVFFFVGQGNGHIQSLVLAVLLILIGVQCFIAGIQADITAANRKILEDIQYRVRKMDSQHGTGSNNEKVDK